MQLKPSVTGEIPGLQSAGGEDSILRKYHYVSSAFITSSPYLLLTSLERGCRGTSRGLLQDAILVLREANRHILDTHPSVG